MIMVKNIYPDAPNNYTGKKAKNAQEAHEAIRPTNIKRRPSDIKKYVNADQFKSHELIWTRALSSQMTQLNLIEIQLLCHQKTRK